MENKEITEGNRIIVEFMGWYQLPEVNKGSNLNWFHKVHTPKVLNNIDIPTDVTQLGFRYNWSLLMPVVEKIEGNVEYEVDIANCVCTISAPDESFKDSFTNVIVCVHSPEASSKIEAVYKAVVKFIQWHNAKLAEPC